MILDPKFLKKMTNARAKLHKAEEGLAGARQEFETAVRRLYIEGASVREIAQTLGLSHQRVHQLVGARPQSWWQRLTNKSTPPPRGCSFCGRKPAAVKKLLGGPGVHICNTCVAQANDALESADPQDNPKRHAAGRFKVTASTGKRRCSFCAKRNKNIPIAAAAGHRICKTCASLAGDHIASEK